MGLLCFIGILSKMKYNNKNVIDIPLKCKDEKIEPKLKRGRLTTAQLALKRQEDYVKELRNQQEKKKERENLKVRDPFRIEDPIEEVAKPKRGRKKKVQEPLSEPEPPAYSEQEPSALSEQEPPALSEQEPPALSEPEPPKRGRKKKVAEPVQEPHSELEPSATSEQEPSAKEPEPLKRGRRKKVAEPEPFQTELNEPVPKRITRSKK